MIMPDTFPSRGESRAAAQAEILSPRVCKAAALTCACSLRAATDGKEGSWAVLGVDSLAVAEHARRHIAECLRLDAIPEFRALRLAAWEHMLGFSGHFATKSRTYSTTLSALRADRAAHQREHARAAGLLPGPLGDTTLIVAS